MKNAFALLVFVLLWFPSYGQELELVPFSCDSFESIDRLPYLDRNDPALKTCFEWHINNRSKEYQEDSLSMLLDIMLMYSIGFESQKVIDLKDHLLRACFRLSDSTYVYSMVAYSYSQMEQHAKARNEINQGLDAATKSTDKRLLFSLHLESVKQYYYMGDSINAFNELDKLGTLLPFADSLNFDRCSYYLEKANSYFDYGDKEQREKSIIFASKAEDCYLGGGAIEQTPYIHQLKVLWHLEKGTKAHLDSAEVIAKRAIEIATEFNDAPMIGTTNGLLGKVFVKKGEFGSAIYHLKKSLAKAIEFQDIKSKRETLSMLSETFAAKKDFKNAYTYLSNHQQTENEIVAKNNKTLFYNLEQQYKTKEKEQEIKLLNQDKILSLQQRNLFIGLAAFLLALALISSYFFYKQRKLTQTITKQYNELQELNKFKDQLFAIIGHDLRNLISRLNVDQRKLVRSTKQTENAHLHPLALKMGTNAENLNGLVENLLFWGMKQSEGFYLHSESLPMKKMAEQVAYNFQNEIEQKKLTIQYDIADDLMVFSDDNILKMSIRNLLNNAIKFSNPNTTILLEGLPNNGKPLLRVIDQGVGISKEKLPILFDINPKKLAKGTEGEKGTGLGLWLCKELLAKVDAQISASSQVGKNTAFTIEFPK